MTLVIKKPLKFQKESLKGQLIKQMSSNTEITISQIVNRTVKTGITKKINEVNENLAHYCKLNKCGLIRHDNITFKHPNSYCVLSYDLF